MWFKVLALICLLSITDLSAQNEDVESSITASEIQQILNSNPDLLDAQNSAQNARIISGQSSELGQFPFAVFLLFSRPEKKYAACGGSLIKRDWILTAAHCLFDSIIGYYLIGSVQQDIKTTTFNGKFNQSQMFIHEEYQRLYIINDIGLIKLSKRVPCSDYVGIVDLPCNCENLFDLEGFEGTVSGFGVQNGTNGDISPNLYFVRMNIISNCECKTYLKDSIFNGMLCGNSTFGGVW